MTTERTYSSDYRKWIHYGGLVTSKGIAQELYQVIASLNPSQNFECRKIQNDNEEYYQVYANEVCVLHLAEIQRTEFLKYLDELYHLTDTSNSIGIINEIAPVNVTMPSWESFLITHLLRVNELSQSLRFSFIGILLLQVIVIPEYVFNLDIPKEVVIGISGTILLALTYTSVKLYKKHFKADVVKYQYINRLSISLCMFIYLGYASEVIIFDVAAGARTGLLSILFELLFFCFIGCFMGLIFSTINYFLVGGKVINKPGEG